MRHQTGIFNIDQSPLPELERIQALIDRASKFAEVTHWGEVAYKDKDFPIHSFSFGSKDKSLPCFALVGGVHGLERIGTQTIISYLESLVERMEWDEDLRQSFERMRFVCLPLLNPTGMYLRRRSTAKGVDLMRNAPIDADGKVPWLAGGHRMSSRLPWFRGPKGADLEQESQVLVDFIEQEVFPSSFAISLDVHSGFGMRDRLWYPHARTKTDFKYLAEVQELQSLLKRSYPNHVYIVESQSEQYLAHGDMWDYIFELHQKAHKGSVFLPLTLEMGSWLWVKKNPLQLLTYKIGSYHPIKAHRQRRIFRRHIFLFEFLSKAAKFQQNWLPR